MRYRPSTPSTNHNISTTHPLKEFATLLGGVLLILFIGYLILGFLVDRAVSHLSVELETELFSHIPLAAFATDNDQADPRVIKLQQLTAALTQCLDMHRPIIVHLQTADTVNAVALPGGHIVVFTGLLDSIETENSLSFILAHELGHFKNRDHLKGLGRGLVLLTMASAITGPSSGFTKLLTPTIHLTQATYSQKLESKADETGLSALNCLYGHVGGATAFFETMASQQDGDGFTHYFESHPQMQDRVTALHELTINNQYPIQPTRPLSPSFTQTP